MMGEVQNPLRIPSIAVERRVGMSVSSGFGKPSVLALGN
jgi:hypothetical protein